MKLAFLSLLLLFGIGALTAPSGPAVGFITVRSLRGCRPVPIFDIHRVLRNNVCVWGKSTKMIWYLEDIDYCTGYLNSEDCIGPVTKLNLVKGCNMASGFPKIMSVKCRWPEEPPLWNSTDA